jgi:hypothetical protein
MQLKVCSLLSALRKLEYVGRFSLPRRKHEDCEVLSGVAERPSIWLCVQYDHGHEHGGHPAPCGSGSTRRLSTVMPCV